MTDDTLPNRNRNPDAETFDGIRLGLPAVVQFGHCRVSQGRLPPVRVGLHQHRLLQLTFGVKGLSRFIGSNDRTYDLYPGQMLVMLPHEPHRLSRNMYGNERYWLFLPLPFAGRDFPGLDRKEATWLATRFARLVTGLYTVPAGTGEILAEAYALQRRDDLDGQELAYRQRLVFRRLLTAVVDARPCGSKVNKGVEFCVQQMQSFPSRKFSMAKLMRQLGASSTTVTKLFREHTGLTPHAFLVSCRIQESLDRLADPSASVADVAESLGFSSAQHFATCFRRELGLSPGEWRLRRAL